MLKGKVKDVLISIVFCIFVLLFPIVSGTIIVINKLDSITGIYVQAGAMFLCCIFILLYLIIRKVSIKLFFKKISQVAFKTSLFYIPLILIYIPHLFGGFKPFDFNYALASFLLYFFVGIAEEMAFRGLIINQLRNSFSTFGVMIISSLIFGIGHMATAFQENNIAMVLLTIFNALIFGYLMSEVLLINGNIGICIIVHFLFDYETKLTAISGNGEMIASIIRGTIMTLGIIYYAVIIKKKDYLSIKFFE